MDRSMPCARVAFASAWIELVLRSTQVAVSRYILNCVGPEVNTCTTRTLLIRVPLAIDNRRVIFYDRSPIRAGQKDKEPGTTPLSYGAKVATAIQGEVSVDKGQQ